MCYIIKPRASPANLLYRQASMKNLLKEQTYSVVIPIAALLYSTLSFSLAKLLIFWRPHWDMTLAWDALVPFLPWTVSIYLASFVYWYLCFVLTSRQQREKADSFFCAHMLMVTLSFLCFILLPTTMERPAVTGGGFWNWLMRVVYWVDSPENLFPSLHCSTAWLCWVGMRRRKDLPLWLRTLVLLLSIAVCVSTLTTRQHVLADVASGIALAEACSLLGAVPRLRARYSRLVDAILRRFVPAD